MTTTRDEHLLVTQSLTLRDQTRIGFQDHLGETTVYGAGRLQEVLGAHTVKNTAAFPTQSSTPSATEGELGEVRFDPTSGRLYVRLHADWSFLTLKPASAATTSAAPAASTSAAPAPGSSTHRAYYATRVGSRNPYRENT